MQILNHKTVVVNPQYADLTEFINSVPQLFAQNEGELIYRGRNQLRAFTYNTRRYVVKAFRKPNLINRFVYGIFRPSKAKRAYDNALLLQDIGIGTPTPIGYINIRKGIAFDKSFLITEESECNHVYSELFEHDFSYTEELLREIGRITAIMHNNGYAHLDYGRGNILFKKDERGLRIDIVDVNRMSFGKLDINAGCKNLERLPATPQMHRWLAESYAKERKMDAEECYHLMVKYRSTQPGKIDGLY
ncbi:MAG: hypothetical protein J6K74_05965 [Marinifilaceae bacterium]|nr:hypothetical protein [Marinifilaceae bacterium]